LLDLYFDVPASSTGQLLQVGCENASSSNSVIYFDDFRFHPVDAPVTSYVYDSRTWQLTHVLNQDNLYTAYEYDAAGKLIRVYKEVLTKAGSAANAERKLIKESQYNYARNATFTVEATAVAITRDRTLSDGTRVDRLQNGCILSNVRGPHTVELKFTNYTVAELNTRINEYCEVCATTREKTGYVMYQLADGCGGAQNNNAWYRALDTNFCSSTGGNRSAKRRKAAPTSTPNPALLPHCPDTPAEPSTIKTANQEQKASLRP
jgi:YD repeat-containing protein